MIYTMQAKKITASAFVTFHYRSCLYVQSWLYIQSVDSVRITKSVNILVQEI